MLSALASRKGYVADLFAFSSRSPRLSSRKPSKAGQFFPSWPGLSRPSTSLQQSKAWMPGTRPGMTTWFKRTRLTRTAKAPARDRGFDQVVIPEAEQSEAVRDLETPSPHLSP